ncbi:hypothetical protein [Moraxella equi]|uniref:Uncharacterized protein n=1 Tax=Moraxella equi TaxID=60442 RepID=A0A378QQY9_9GAMM|nr:hypothetical protein [Moraxella equi]OPH34989.1 hypothetical protein B5J93_11570 [Moraxella equi]STZ02872.1 Uncharacterised protein [Moraxella equi]
MTKHKLNTALHKAFGEISELLDCPNEIIINPDDPEQVVISDDLQKSSFKLGILAGFTITKQSLRQQFNIN